MSTTLKIKRSITSGNTPSNLSLGELAVNIPDKKIWIGDFDQQPVLISEYGIGGSGGGETYYEGLGINIDTNNFISIDPGQGLSVDTGNGINLDLNTIPRIDTSISKADLVPFLDVSTGTTDLITAQNFVRTTMYTGLSTGVYDGTNDEYLGISLQDNNPSSFRISTLQNGTGVKSEIFKIDTEGAYARTYLNGSHITISPDEQLDIGSVATPTYMISQEINLSNCELFTFTTGSATVSGVSNITAGNSGNLYITGNLIVSGFVETDVGIRGATDITEEYLGIGMVLDGGQY